MRQQGWGRIINVASEPGIQSNPFMPHCNAPKAAFISLTKSLSKAYREEGILVNAVSPAFVMTPLVESMLADEVQKRGGVSAEEVEAAFIEEKRPNIIVRRAGTSEETAAGVAFLASERASFVTASDCRADGGSAASIS